MYTDMEASRGSWGSAFLDPMFTAPVGFSVELSPGIGNSIDAIPEPSTWAMMLIGFAVIGYAGYRSRRTS
jgi:hypothetical protein